MNTNLNTNTTMNTAATNGSNILTNDGKTQTQSQAQLLECLQKLDAILAQQLRLEQLLSAQGVFVNSISQQNASAAASINA